jgi:hypothetical protein
MTDWKEVARARGISGSGVEIEQLAAVLEPLERAFAPLVREIPVETEPATVFSPAGTERA